MFSMWSGMKQDDHSLLVYVHLLNVLLGPVGEASLWYMYVRLPITSWFYAVLSLSLMHSDLLGITVEKLENQVKNSNRLARV